MFTTLPSPSLPLSDSAHRPDGRQHPSTDRARQGGLGSSAARRPPRRRSRRRRRRPRATRRRADARRPAGSSSRRSGAPRPRRSLLDRDEAVGVTPEDERRHRHAVQPLLKLRVVRPLPERLARTTSPRGSGRRGTRAAAASAHRRRATCRRRDTPRTSSSGMLKKSTVGCSGTRRPKGAASTNRRTRAAAGSRASPPDTRPASGRRARSPPSPSRSKRSR